MRACVLRDGQLAVTEVADPHPEPGQLLVRTLACGICGTDLHFARHAETIVRVNDELWPTLGPAAIGDSHVDLAKDVFMGHEFCGKVLAAGRGTEGPPPGTAVVSVPVVLSGTGVHRLTYNNDFPCGYAERMLLSAELALPVPGGLDPRLAALTGPLAVGVHAVAKSGIQPVTPQSSSAAGRSASPSSPLCVPPVSRQSSVLTSHRSAGSWPSAWALRKPSTRAARPAAN